MPFSISSKDPDQKAAEKAIRQVRKAAEQAAAEERRAQQERERKARFEAMPEFVVREYREVTVKAANPRDAIEIAKLAFKHGQEDDGSIALGWLPWGSEGNTIDRIRRVAIKVASFLD